MLSLLGTPLSLYFSVFVFVSVSETHVSVTSPSGIIGGWGKLSWLLGKPLLCAALGSIPDRGQTVNQDGRAGPVFVWIVKHSPQVLKVGKQS